MLIHQALQHAGQLPVILPGLDLQMAGCQCVTIPGA